MMHLETTCHVSHVTCQLQHVTFRPFPNHKSYGLANSLIMVTIPYPTILHHTTMSHVSHITCQISHFTCHLSCITFQVSHVTHFFLLFFLLESGSWWRVCYQWGLPRIVFRPFLIKNSVIPKIYLFQPVVVRFWSLKKAN